MEKFPGNETFKSQKCIFPCQTVGSRVIAHDMFFDSGQVAGVTGFRV
jgi:hypothetical protein